MVCFFCGKSIESEESNHYGLHTDCFCEWFQIDKPLVFRNIYMKNTGSEPANHNNEDINSSFFQGKFRKYSAELGDDTYILKVKEEDFPELPAVEYLSNQIAESLGLDIPQYHLIDFHGTITFAVKSFIRPGKLETLHHIYHFLNNAPFDCETILEILKDKTGRLCEMEKFVKLCLFDSLIGNHDRHGRNLGLIERAGKYRLSPFYDNPSYTGVEEKSFLTADLNPRGRIAVKATDEPLMNDYVNEFKRLGMENAVNEFRRLLNMKKLDKLTGWEFLTRARAQALKNLMKKRFEQLYD